MIFAQVRDSLPIDWSHAAFVVLGVVFTYISMRVSGTQKPENKEEFLEIIKTIVASRAINQIPLQSPTMHVQTPQVANLTDTPLVENMTFSKRLDAIENALARIQDSLRKDT